MSYLIHGLELVFPVGDHAPDDFDMLFFLGLQFLIHPPFSDFFLGIGRGIVQKGLVILNRIFFAYEGLVQYLESGLNGGFGFFPGIHLDIPFQKFQENSFESGF